MLKLSPEDGASIATVLGTLEAQAVKLGPESELACMWRDWTDILEGRPLTWQVPWSIV
jgi:hypothetical protein